MKKTFILLSMVLIVSLSMLVACGGGGPQVKGKYVLTSIEDKAMGGKVDAAKLAEMGMTMSIEFLDGGKCKFDVAGMAVDCTFKLEGKTLTLTLPDGEKNVGVVEGNKIMIENEVESTVDDKVEKYKQKMIFEKR